MSIEAQKIIVFLAFGVLAALIMCGVALAAIWGILDRAFILLRDNVIRVEDVGRARVYAEHLGEKLREGPTHGGLR